MRVLGMIGIPLCVLALVACGSDSSADTTPSTTSSTETPTATGEGQEQAAAPAADLSALVLATAPSEAATITSLKQAIEPGAAVTLTGRVGGRANPFIDGRAAMTVVDPGAVAACDTIEGDSCGTPWDFCCESQSKIAAAMATVQVVDEQGMPKKVGLNGLGGLAPGSMVVVTGTVSPNSADGNLIVDATGIHVQAAKPVVE